MSERAKSDGESVGEDYRDRRGAPDDTRDRLLDRRGYLKMAGAAVATVATTAGTAASAGGVTRRGIEFDRVLDAVDDLGLDPTGGSPVNDRLESALEEGTLVRFPEGEYLFDDTVMLDADRVGFLGEGDARFRPADGFRDLLVSYGDPPDGVLFENIDIDMRADGTTTGLRIFCRNHFHIQDVEFLGRGLTSDSGQVSAFILGVATESGRGVLRNAVAKKGSRIDGYAGGNGRIGVWVGWSNKGTVRIENCDFREFGNNGTYTSRTPGDVEIVNSYFLNNNAANVRIGGEGSYVENCTIEIDMEKYTGPELGDLSTGFGLRGIHIDQGVQLEGAESIPAGAEVRDCEVIGRNAPFGIALVNLSPQGRSLNLVNTRLKVDIDKMWAVRRGRPGAIDWRVYQETPPKPHWIRMENVSITGSAASRETVRLVGADECIIRNCCINQTGINRDGVYIVDADDCVIEDSTIDVTGDAIDLENATVDTSSITREGSCTLPEADDPTDDSTDDSTTTTTADSEDREGKELVIDGGGVYERVNYTFSVDGTVEPGAAANDNDVIEGSSVSGQVEGGVDSYWVTGDFTSFELDGDIPVRLDGETVEPQDLVVADDTTTDGSDSDSTTEENDSDSTTEESDSDSTTDGSETLDDSGRQQLVIDGGGVYERVNYTFSVDGSVEPGARANDSDTIDGTTVEGHVEGGLDSYWVTGDFTSFELDGDVPVRLDGETVDPDNLVTVTRELVIDGGGTTGQVAYTFSVDGTVERGSAANDNDIIEGSSVSGQVEGGVDSYRITGTFTNFQLDGDVPVRIDGETVDPATLGADHEHPHELIVTGGETQASYHVETTGSVAKRDGMWGAESADSAEGSVASGTVEADRDTFGFSGSIVRLEIDGDASVTFGE